MSEFDMVMINEEINYFPELKDQIVKRFDHVNSYKEILNEFCKKIDNYNDHLYERTQKLDEIATLIMREDVDSLQQKLKELRIENIN